MELKEMRHIFESVGWFVPPYIQLGSLQKLANRIKTAKPNEKHKLLEIEIGSFYTSDNIAVMLLERYNKTIYVSDFKREISEAIEAAQLGLFHAAVSTLIPVVEGIFRKLALARHRRTGNGTKWIIDNIDVLMKRQQANNVPALIIDERILMLQSFQNFLKKKLFVHTSEYTGTDNLNRHGILHGIFQGYGTKRNFYKVLSLLDMLCFFIALETKQISALAPDFTPESQKLANYYCYLSVLRDTLLKGLVAI